MPKPRNKLNINKLRKVLYDKYKKRFNIKNWDDTLFYARQVSEVLSNYQWSQSISNIQKAVRLVRPSKRKKREKLPDPLIPEEFIKHETRDDLHAFFQTDDLINLIKSSDTRIHFTSKYVFSRERDFEIQGGTSIDYENYLQDWAKACAKLQYKYRSEGGDPYAIYWRIQEQPKKIKNKWYAEIIQCDEQGQETSFGVTFIPQAKEEPQKTIEEPQPEQLKQPEPEITQIEKERLKKSQLNTLIDYRNSIVEDIKFRKSMDMDITDAKQKYEKVTKDIDKLMGY